MNKKEKNIELRIYELLGIKIFRKMAFKFRDLIWVPLTLKISKEKRHEMLYNEPSNYIMNRGHGIQDLRDFKKQLLLNSVVHICCLFICLPVSLMGIIGNVSFIFAIINIFLALIHTYCIMLQRYNQIRINQVIKRMKPREDAKKSELKKELIKEDSLLSEHTYKVVNKRDKEKNVTFEELLETATYKQLKLYRDYLSYFRTINQTREQYQSFSSEEQQIIKVPLQKNKTLKLELNLKKQNESIN